MRSATIPTTGDPGDHAADATIGPVTPAQTPRMSMMDARDSRISRSAQPREESGLTYGHWLMKASWMSSRISQRMRSGGFALVAAVLPAVNQLEQRTRSVL